MIDLQGPDANYGGCAEIFMQNAWDTSQNRREEYRVLFAFDLSSIASTCTVKTASLLLLIKELDGAAPISVNQLSEEWDEGVGLCSYGTTGDACWQNRKTNTPWKTAGGTSLPAGVATIADGSTSLTWNAHALVQGWVAKPLTNHGLMLTTPYSPPSTHYVKFYSREAAQPAIRPRLTVTFTCP